VAGYVDAVGLESDNFPRVISQQTHLPKTEVGQYLGSDTRFVQSPLAVGAGSVNSIPAMREQPQPTLVAPVAEPRRGLVKVNENAPTRANYRGE